jgi:hypothetical protein
MYGATFVTIIKKRKRSAGNRSYGYYGHMMETKYHYLYLLRENKCYPKHRVNSDYGRMDCIPDVGGIYRQIYDQNMYVEICET